MVALRKRQSSQTHLPVSPTGDGARRVEVTARSNSPPRPGGGRFSPHGQSTPRMGRPTAGTDDRPFTRERLMADGHPPVGAAPTSSSRRATGLRQRLRICSTPSGATRLLSAATGRLLATWCAAARAPKAQFGERDYAFVEARGLRLDSPEVVRAAEQAMTSGAPWPCEEFYTRWRALPLPPAGNDGGRAKSRFTAWTRISKSSAHHDRKAALATEQREAEPEHERPVVSPEEIRRAALTSAPPSREMPSMRTGRQEGRVTLSVVEREIAKGSGLTDIEYAAQKLRLQREKAADPERFSDR